MAMVSGVRCLLRQYQLHADAIVTHFSMGLNSPFSLNSAWNFMAPLFRSLTSEVQQSIISS